MKKDTPNHVKFIRLKRRLRLRRWEAVGLLESIWHLTATAARIGDLGRFSNDEIAEQIDWQDDADELVNALVETGWLDRSDEHRLVVHDWLDHCPNYVRAIVSRQDTSDEQPRNGDGKYTKSDTKSPTKTDTKSDTKTGVKTAVKQPPHLSPVQSSPVQSSRSPVGRRPGRACRRRPAGGGCCCGGCARRGRDRGADARPAAAGAAQPPR